MVSAEEENYTIPKAINMFAPFFERCTQLYAYAEEGYMYNDIIPGLIIASHPEEDEKYYIVTNAKRYSRFKFKLERGDTDAHDFMAIYLIPGSKDYDIHMQEIGVSTYRRSEIPDAVFDSKQIIYPKVQKEKDYSQ